VVISHTLVPLAALGEVVVDEPKDGVVDRASELPLITQRFPKLIFALASKPAVDQLRLTLVSAYGMPACIDGRIDVSFSLEPHKSRSQ
jgi:hypothetical protein